MSSNLHQSIDSLQIGHDHSNEAASALEPFKPFPDEILPLIFDQLTAFQRCLILSVCRNWNAILLAGRGFWQIVHLPLHLSISTAISILQTFNLRSGFSLKEVVFEGMIDDYKAVDLIFEELKKSSATIRALVLPQLAKYNTQTRNLARTLLPGLHFFYSDNHGGRPRYISRMWTHLLCWQSQRSSNLSNEGDTESPGLRYFATNSLERVEAQEKIWFKELQRFQVHSSRSLEDLHLILEASKSSLKELNLSLWGTEWKDSEDVNLKPISMDHPSGISFQPPYNASAAKALSRFLEFPGKVKVLGNLASSVCFEMKCLIDVTMPLYDEGENERTRGPSMTPEELKEKTDLFLKMNPSLLRLVLFTRRGNQNSTFHLNYLLERLIVSSNSSSTQQHGSPNATQGQVPLLLSKLQLIEIHEPTELDGKLLKKCLESRRKLNPGFGISVRSEGGDVGEGKWEEQSWMK